MSREEITEQAVQAANRMYLADRPQVALDYVAEALEADPQCYEALVMAGELYDCFVQELGLDDQEAVLLAISYYDRAIAAQPDLAEAYAEKAIALLHLEYDERFEAALACSARGLALLDVPPSSLIYYDVWVNIGESLYRAKALALMGLGQEQRGREALAEGLSRFPNSEYLTSALEAFLPDLP